jgi:hydrogenase/urease accessory protein HupE
MRFLLLVVASLFVVEASSHEMTMAEMDVRQISPTEFLWQWTTGQNDLTPVWPEGCTTETNLLRCANGLRGALAVEGIGKRYSAAMVKVSWLDGQSRVYTVTTAQHAVRLYGSAEDERGMGEIASAYTVLGVEHILTGFDHLLFVFSLLFLVGFNRRLVWTITAFTAAHSVTLALAALGLLTLRSPPVEATIALSIVLVAAEALHERDTLSRRWPAMVAFLFGLVHGLGFAGALKEIGLPQNHLSVALVTFNLGVEIGQLAIVALAYGFYKILNEKSFFAKARTPILYAIGSIAAYWSLTRIANIAF